MSIYNNSIPYFYIIRNKQTGIMYVGSRWSKKSNPQTFMTKSGYKTSSKIINEIINKHGLDIFEILRIDTYCDNLSVYDYETLFLRTHDCANSKDYYNIHNNSFYSEQMTEKSMETCLEKYGYKYSLQSPQIQEKRKQTCLQKYGCEYSSQAPEVNDKRLKTMIDKYGVLYPMQNDIIAEKAKNTNVKKYGYGYILQIPKYRDISLQKTKEKYNIIDDDIINVFQIEEIKQKSKITHLNKYGVDHQSKREKVCKYCGEYKNIQHEHLCPKNSDRKLNRKCGDNHPKPGSRTYKLQSPTGEIYFIKGRIKPFCKENGFDWGMLRTKHEHKGWKLL